MAYDNGKITAPVGIKDIRNALGIDSADLHTLCASERVNPMAKFKPVRYAKKGSLTNAERASVRYGMGATVPSFSVNDPSPSVTWTYYRVRENIDFSRYTDFDGYYAYACVPFAFDVSGALNDGVGFRLFVDSMAGTYYQENGYSNERWDEDLNLSLTDLISGATNASSEGYIGFIIHDLTAGDSVAVVTNVKLKDISSTVPVVVLYAEQHVISGVTYPAIPIISDSTRSGNTFRFISALFNNGPSNPTANAYEIMPSSMIVYSLAFRDGSDRRDLALYLNDTIMGLRCSIANSGITMTYLGTVDGMLEYSISGNVDGIYTTPSGHWAVDEVVSEITIRSDNGYVGEERMNVVVEKSVSIPLPNTTYSLRAATLSDIRYYTWPQVPQTERAIIITGKVKHIYEEVYYENTIKVRATN